MAIAKKKKRFFDVEIPIIRKTTQLQAIELSELEGKYIKYDLTRLLKGKSVLLDAKISIKDNEAVANPIGITIMKHSLKNMVRKGTDYIEDSFSAPCKDAQVTIKTLLVARRKISRRVRKALREKAKKELLEEIKNKTGEQIIDDILKNNMQKPLSLKLKKIYPLSLCEIRFFKIEKPIEGRTLRKQAVKQEAEVEEKK